MTPYRISWRSLFHEAPLNVALVLAIALGVAVLLGAFAAGDTLKAALRRHALETLGRTELALQRSGGTFREELVDDLSADTGHQAAPVLRLRGVVTTDGGKRLPGAWIVGVDSRFGRLGDATPFSAGFTQGALLNRAAADRLGVRRGDEIVLRVARPESMPGEAALAAGRADSVGLRVQVAGIVEDAQLGRFALEAQTLAPENVFLPLSVLQDLAGVRKRVNLALLSTELVSTGGGNPVVDGTQSARTLNLAKVALRRCRQLEDLGLEFRVLPGNGGCELRSTSFWIDPDVAQIALGLDSRSSAVSAYLVKAIGHGTNLSPYAFVAGGEGSSAPWPSDTNTIVLNNWLSVDIGATTGDTVTLVYDQLGAGRELREASRSFRVSRIVPIGQVDPGLMPDLPGIGDVSDCRDWRGGAFVATRWIRQADQDYWSAYRGTPRALLSIDAARAMWNTRWGVLTAVRFASEAGSSRELTVRLLEQLPAEASGWQWIELRERLLQASSGSQDFAALFATLSILLVASAMFIAATLFGMRADRRRRWIGLLRAVGYRTQLVQQIYMVEGLGLVVFGSAAGILLGLGYARLVLHAMDGIWAHQTGFAGAPPHLALKHAVLAILAVGGAALAAQGMVLAWAQRRQVRAQLDGPAEASPASRRIQGRARGWYLAALSALVLAGAAIGSAWRHPGAADMAACLGGGLLVMLAGLLLLRALLIRKSGGTARTLLQLGLANASRRISRALSNAAMVSIAVFLLIMLGAVRPQMPGDADQPGGPTGGYTWCVELAQPLFALPPVFQNAECLALRLQEGDDASCLNPQLIMAPRVVGVPSQLLAERGAFTFAESLPECPHPGSWRMLGDPAENAVPAIVDESTLMWGLKKKLGDILMLTDDAGQIFPARLVGTLKDSVFQGMVLIDKDAFRLRYPSIAGYRLLLVNAPRIPDAGWMEAAAKSLETVGGELRSSMERLWSFQRVTQVYLEIFTTLGWLALLLAIAGVSLTMAHQARERRGEIACLRALGFGRSKIGALLLVEQGIALAAGALSGTAGAMTAILPMGARLARPGAVVEGAVMLAFILMCGLIATAAVVWIALNRPVIEGLREE